MARTALCTSAQVLRSANIDAAEDVGGADVVTDSIEEAREEVLEDYGDPPKRSTFVLDGTQTKYEFRVDKKKAYAIEKVYVLDSNNNRIEYTDGTASETNLQYTKDLDFNAITFHANTVSAYDGLRVIIDYIPNNIHWLARLKAALYLLDKTNVINAEGNTPTLGLRILQRIGRIEASILTETAVGSEDEKTYDPTIGDVIKQRRFYIY